MVDIKIIRCSVQDVAGKLAAYGSIFIVYDRNVRSVVRALGVPAAASLEIEATERNKVLSTVEDICRWLMRHDAGRDAFLLGVGGGVTTDIAGFAASIYKRGIRFGFVPTTLLAQVDAAIGGKDGVNLDSYKNMIGAIRQPEMTFICPEVLETLPAGHLAAGGAELLKTFIIDDSGSWYDRAVESLEKHGDLTEFIGAAAGIKAGIAGRDPYERGERRLLNLGHTFAHAIEKLSEESIPHGQAVAMGIILAAKFAEKKGTAKTGLAEKLEADFKRCGLPTECPFPIKDLGEAMKKDKKAEGAVVHFVLPERIGHVVTMDLDVDEVTGLLTQDKD